MHGEPLHITTISRKLRNQDKFKAATAVRDALRKRKSAMKCEPFMQSEENEHHCRSSVEEETETLGLTNNLTDAEKVYKWEMLSRYWTVQEFS